MTPQEITLTIPFEIFIEQNGNLRSYVIEREESDGWRQDFDEIEEVALDAAEMAIEEMCDGSSCEEIQATNLLQIKVKNINLKIQLLLSLLKQAGYDDGFLNKVGGSAAQAESYIKSALPHVQAAYCHESLGTKISIQRIGDIKHYSGRSLQATTDKLKEMWDPTLEDLGTADLIMYMGYDE